MEEKTYSMTYKCWNCGLSFTKHITKGTPALEKGGKCPYCGMCDGHLDINDHLHIHTTTR